MGVPLEREGTTPNTADKDGRSPHLGWEAWTHLRSEDSKRLSR